MPQYINVLQYSISNNGGKSFLHTFHSRGFMILLRGRQTLLVKNASETRLKAETRETLNGCFLFQRPAMRRIEYSNSLASMARILTGQYKKRPSVSAISAVMFKTTESI